MRYYKCNRCGETFDEDDIQVKYVHITGYNVPDSGYDEAEYYCPCGSDDYYEVFKCEDCEKSFDDEDLYEGRCEGCLKDWAFHDSDEVWNYLKADLDSFAEFVKTVEEERSKRRKEIFNVKAV